MFVVINLNFIMAVKLNSPKRQRQSNTSVEQYELYVFYLETDEIFRMGIPNSAASIEYLQAKWKELTEKLNCICNGPQMDSRAWKKRFNNWKDQTRYKNRKIVNKIEAGEGPLGKLALTDLEARALAAWGITNSIPPEIEIQNNRFDFIDLDRSFSPVESSDETIVDDPLTEIKQALNTFDGNINGESHNKLFEIATKYVEVEKEKLKFEIAKFKFLHPNFNYDLPNL